MPTPSPRHAATPPAPPPAQPTPPPARQSHQSSHSSSHTSSSSHVSSHGSSHASSQQSQQDKFHQSAAAMQALQQQLFRGNIFICIQYLVRQTTGKNSARFHWKDL